MIDILQLQIYVIINIQNKYFVLKITFCMKFNISMKESAVKTIGKALGLYIWH